MRSMIIFTLAFLAATCNAETIVLHADFDADTVGAEPSIDPVGPPDGDELKLFTSGGSVLVKDWLGDLDTQPVVLSRTSTAPLGLQFFLDPNMQDCTSFDIHWRQVLDREVQFFYMSMFSTNHKSHGSVEFRPGFQMTANGSNHVLVSTYASGEAMTVDVHLDLEAGTLDVSINGVPDPGGQNLTLSQSGGIGLLAIGTGFGMSDHYQVALDDVHVTGTGCSFLADESMSWGALKAAYR